MTYDIIRNRDYETMESCDVNDLWDDINSGLTNGHNRP